MKTSDITATTNLKILLYGASGRGKTRFIATCPKPIYIADFSDGLLSIRGEPDIEYDIFRDNLPLYLGDKPNPQAEQLLAWANSALAQKRSLPPLELSKSRAYRRPTMAFTAFMARFNQLIGDPTYKTIAIDDSTFMADAALAEVCYLEKQDIAKPRIQDWGMAIAYVQAVLDAVRDVPKVIVMTAGEQVIADEVPGGGQELHYGPLIFGRNLPLKMPHWYDEVYRATIRTEGMATKYVLDCKGDGRIVAKTRLDLQNRFVDSSFAAIVAAIRK